MTTRSGTRACLALLPLTGILAASCTTLQRGPVERRYEVVLDHKTTGGGLGLLIRRQVQVKAQIVERRTDEGRSVTVKSITASGDSADAASALTLDGAMVTVGPGPGEVAFGERRVSSPLSVVDAALLSQVLVTIPADESVPSASFKLYLPTKGARVPLTLGQKLGETTRYRGASGRFVSVTAGGSTETTISAFQASSDGSNLYVAQPALRDLIGPAASQPFDTEVRGAAKEEPSAVAAFFEALGCALSFGACEWPKPRTRPKPMPGQEIVVVKGPRSLDVRLSEKIDIGVYGVADKGGQLVGSTTSGRSILEGTLPGGTGVPPELEREKLQVISTWTAEKSLLPADPGGRRRSLAGGLALLMLLAAVLATGVMAAGQRRT